METKNSSALCCMYFPPGNTRFMQWDKVIQLNCNNLFILGFGESLKGIKVSGKEAKFRALK
jgi:hypothetical protein